MDTTAKKNNLLWPLCLIVAVNEENKSIIVGQALMNHETKDNFTFVLESLCCKEVEGMEEPVMYAPSVVFTDEDVAEILAVNKVLPNALDFRCQWHADRDLEKMSKQWHDFSEDEKTELMDYFKTSRNR